MEAFWCGSSRGDSLLIIPLPQGYKSWQEWGQALVKIMLQKTAATVVEAPSYNAALVPAKGKGGDVIYISNTDKLAYWKVGTSRWRYVDESGNV